MSSGKKRRVQADDSVASSLDRSPWVRYALYLCFCAAAAVLVMRGVAQAEGLEEFTIETKRLNFALYAFFIAMSGAAVLELNLELAARRNGRVILILGGVLVHLALMRGIELFSELIRMPVELGFLLIPFVLAPMVHTVLLGRALGIFSTIYVSLLGVLLMPDNEMGMYQAVSLLCGLVAVQALHQTRRRVQLLRAGFYAGLMALVLSVIFGAIDLGSVMQADALDEWKMVGMASATALGMGIVIALLVSGLLPVLEGLFKLTTDISWLELSDLNHRLLRRLQLEAPGTFHHSLVVASLSEAAAEAVGANAAMCRVGAYYHDIGKLKKPEYFIENQNDGAENPHDALTPTMSALIITAHVKDGVDLALKHKLNPRVIDVIREHHGDSLVSFFYRRAQEQKRAEMEKIEKKLENPEDLPKIDEKNFRYPGPTPRSRESGIISLADAIESASRTIKKPTPAKIRSLVDDIVASRINDGQLDECLLTVRDLSRVKDVFCKTLRSMLHSRIDYPKDDDKSRSKSDLEKRAAAEKRNNGATAPAAPEPTPTAELKPAKR
ncbi:HD family phosphohydrolase [Haloferula chungangensis]|uniref:HD family phosphohydrolase n=1 Tax=Haloferula chungangensis TaxID=1048331 RepID=A0ABW2L7I0_9BACT